MLLTALRELWFDNKFEKSRRKKVQRRTRFYIFETGNFLRADEDACSIAVSSKMAKTTSILKHCQTLKALKLPEINTSKVCKRLRKFLKSSELCTCSRPEDTKENAPETARNESGNTILATV